MEKIILFRNIYHNDDAVEDCKRKQYGEKSALDVTNELLEEGWNVKSISSTVAVGSSSGFNYAYGETYIVLQK